LINRNRVRRKVGLFYCRYLHKKIPCRFFAKANIILMILELFLSAFNKYFGAIILVIISIKVIEK